MQEAENCYSKIYIDNNMIITGTVMIDDDYLKILHKTILLVIIEFYVNWSPNFILISSL